MPDITKADGTPCMREPRSLNLRLMDVFKRPGQTAGDIMAEFKALTADDKEDFRRWFSESGYPCT